MMKLLIVDDEQIEREGLRAILQKAFPDILIEEAKNGSTAIALADEFHPDLILMDIKMPGMSGLEAIAAIKENQPHIKFVMVTAFDMFEYARQAIKLGVKDYLLKPSKATEITTTVGRVLQECKSEKHSLESRKIQDAAMQKALALVETDVVTQLLFDHVHEVHINMLVEMLDIRSANQSFIMLVILPEEPESYYSMVKEKVRKAHSGWVGAMYSHQIPIIVFRKQDVSFRSQAASLARDILSLSNSSLSKDWFIGIGNVCDSLDQIRQSYQESLIASMDRTIPARHRFYMDTPILGGDGNRQHDKQKQKQFFDQVRLGEWGQVRQGVMEVIQSCENDGVNLLQAQQRVLELLWLTTRLMDEIGIEVETPIYSAQAQDYRHLRSETSYLLEKIRQKHAENYEKKDTDSILKIKHYIIEHSHEDISLEALGNKVGLSPIYISKIFKEKLGVNYIDFLTECRIEKAKKLLNDLEKSIKEITFEVGYHEPNYFSKVFKKATGTSPKEYRTSLFGNKAIQVRKMEKVE
ncbi:response regulator [Bacillus sp. EB01]|uniref:response regulator n=1 Tax=Bacillus sp. EB01 TaxID=1347086 RepID=UPI0005C5820B|nr:response regulator [Bacillus sp. EB01]